MNDIGKGDLVVNPIVDPPLHAEFVVIQPARRTLSVPARLFLERFEAEIAHIQAIWDRALAGPVAANGRKRQSQRAQHSLILAGIGLEAGGLDAGDGAGLVLVRGVAGDADRADDVARRRRGSARRRDW